MIKRLLVAVPVALVGALWFFYLSLPWPILLGSKNPERTSFMELRIAQAQTDGETLRLKHEWIPLGRISRNLRRAVIVGEDGNFYDHDGIDWEALAEETHYEGDGHFSWFSPADLRSLAGSVVYYGACLLYTSPSPRDS